MDPNTLFNQVEIRIYSTLTYILSGINYIKASFQQLLMNINEFSISDGDAKAGLDASPAKGSLLIKWESIKTVFLLLFLWMVLGFATGFLIGMIRPR